MEFTLHLLPWTWLHILGTWQQMIHHRADVRRENWETRPHPRGQEWWVSAQQSRGFLQLHIRNTWLWGNAHDETWTRRGGQWCTSGSRKTEFRAEETAQGERVGFFRVKSSVLWLCSASRGKERGGLATDERAERWLGTLYKQIWQDVT